MSPHASRHLARRRIFLVKPRFQGFAALCFAAVVLAGGVLFAVSFHRTAGSTLRIASLHGHFYYPSANEILGGALALHISALSAFVLAGCFLVLLFLVRRVREGTGRLLETFRISMDGDLSSPTDASGISDLADLGKKVDAARSHTLSLLVGIRAEAEFLRSEPLGDEEFARRWDALKAALQRVAP